MLCGARAQRVRFHLAHNFKRATVSDLRCNGDTRSSRRRERRWPSPEAKTQASAFNWSRRYRDCGGNSGLCGIARALNWLFTPKPQTTLVVSFTTDNVVLLSLFPWGETAQVNLRRFF